MVQKIHRTFYMLAATGRITFAKLAKIRDMQGLRPPSKQEKTSPTRLNPKICRTFAKAKALVAKLVDAPDLGSGDFGRVGSSPIRRTFFICYTNQHPLPMEVLFLFAQSPYHSDAPARVFSDLVISVV